MLSFRPVTLEDRDWISAYFHQKNYFSAKYSFAYNWIYAAIYPTFCCEEDGFLYMRFLFQQDPSRPVYLCPVGKGSLKEAVLKIQETCAGEGTPFHLYGISVSDQEKLASAFPDMIFTTHRSSYDYIYSREALAKLAGKKYHGKRNHIARFKDNDWHYEPMTPDNLAVCLDMHREWERQQRQYMNDSMMEDNRGTLRAFRDFEALGLEGGLLYQGSRLVAYTMGEPLTTDTYAVHFEKAFPDINGAYPAINQEFVLHNMEAYQYINREEDTGDEGLRKAKLSYHPVIILQEYEATLDEE